MAKKKASAEPSASNVGAFKTEFFNFLNATQNLDLTHKQKQADRFTLTYPEQWTEWQKTNPDSPASRGKFWVEMTVESYWRDVWASGNNKERAQGVPPADPYPT